MDLSKLGTLDISRIETAVHIIGCGSVGSTIAELLARYGVNNYELYDDDVVSEHNIVNQMFVSRQVGMKKTEALTEIIKSINPDAVANTHERYEPKNGGLYGYVFLCVDNIDTRRAIAETERFNPSIVCMADCRTGYMTSQGFFADWSNTDDIEKLIKSMDYTNEESEAESERTGNRSACGLDYCVAPTVRLICTYAVLNFINFVTSADSDTVKIWRTCFCYNTPTNTEIQTFK